MCDDKFHYSFCESLSVICDFGEEIETTKHYPLHCSSITLVKQSLLQNIEKINDKFLSMDEKSLTQFWLTGNRNMPDQTNILYHYILTTKKFDNPLILQSSSNPRPYNYGYNRFFWHFYLVRYRKDFLCLALITPGLVFLVLFYMFI